MDFCKTKEKFFKDKGLDPKTGLPIKDEADDFEDFRWCNYTKTRKS